MKVVTFDYQNFLASITMQAGVYKMIDAQNRVLYVGKARHLKNRLSSYFRNPEKLDIKTRLMISQLNRIEVTITANENEALLLENTLIKSLLPKYNILLKDDKSYPYLLLSNHEFPRLQIYRGRTQIAGECFGPYTNVSAIYEILDILQKLFKIRACSDVFFKNRSRPCLQYQIKRCTAPCVNYITAKEYHKNIEYVRLFLSGKNEAVIEDLLIRMEKSADQLAFEEAAYYRNQITKIRQIQKKQQTKTQFEHVDMIAITQGGGVFCIVVLSIRHNHWLGNQAYFPQIPAQITIQEALSAFLSQYYLNNERSKINPLQIYMQETLTDSQWISQVLTEQWKYQVRILKPRRIQEKKWLQLALINAQQALENQLATLMHYEQLLESLQTQFSLATLPKQIACFDISHTQGEATMAACVVFGKEGPLKNSYRRFSIQNINPGDDYAAIAQAVTRYYLYLKEHTKPFPDILIVDGGKGQLNQVKTVFATLQIPHVVLIGIAKGITRKAGAETIWILDQKQPLLLAENSPILHFLQRIRDEAHRFAITGHRQKRDKTRRTSTLEQISGVGPKRRQALLRFFGGLQGVLSASIDDLCHVPGIHTYLAKHIYDCLHTIKTH